MRSVAQKWQLIVEVALLVPQEHSFTMLRYLRHAEFGQFHGSTVCYLCREIPGGAATCSEGFVKCFMRVPRLLGCTAAAMLPKQARGTFRKVPPSRICIAPKKPEAKGSNITPELTTYRFRWGWPASRAWSRHRCRTSNKSAPPWQITKL